MTKAIDQGRCDDLTGSGLVRSAGGWAAVMALRSQKARVKGDERILGDGGFVSAILSKCDEALDEAYILQSKGIDLAFIAQRVARLLEMSPEQVWQPGKTRRLVTARSLLCYWAVRKLNIRMAALGRRLGISTVAVSKSVRRGAAIAAVKDYHLVES